MARRDNWQAVLLIEAFLAATPEGAALTRINSVTVYGSWLSKAARLLGMLPRWTPHCPRAGWATDQWVAGVEFTQLREAGRWKHDNTLRIYLDTCTAIDALAYADVACLLNWFRQLDFAFTTNWSAI